MLVATTSDRLDAVIEQATELGIATAVIGSTDDSANLTIGETVVGVEELNKAWSSTLPELFDHAVGANAVVE